MLVIIPAEAGLDARYYELSSDGSPNRMCGVYLESKDPPSLISKRTPGLRRRIQAIEGQTAEDVTRALNRIAAELARGVFQRQEEEHEGLQGGL